jgi:adenylate cyclase
MCYKSTDKFSILFSGLLPIYWLSILYVFLLFFSSCNNILPQKTIQAIAHKGTIDLRDWNFETNGTVELKGEWALTLNSFLKPSTYLANVPEQTYINVPGKWNAKDGIGFGTYQLCILLPPEKSKLALKIYDVATAYTLFVNGKNILTNGKTGTNAENSIPLFSHPITVLSDLKDTLLLTMYVSNFHNFEGGILSNIQLGLYTKIDRETESGEMLGNILIGALVVSFLIYLCLAIFRKENRYYFSFSWVCLFMAIHYMCMNERWLYSFLGEGYWQLVNHIEFISLMGTFFLLQITIDHFLHVTNTKIFRICGLILYGGQAICVVFLPITISSAETAIIPFNILILFAYNNIHSFIGLKKKIEGSSLLLLSNLIMIVFLISDGFFLNQHVGGLLLSHYGFFIYTMCFSIFLAWQSTIDYKKVKQLTLRLSGANNKLEAQNSNLENVISIRTAQLLEIEKKTHVLELEKKQRDMEAISANNRLKQDVSRKMILELERLNKTDVDFKLALKRLISSLKQQYSLDEKLNTLENDPDIVNAAFLDRLSTRFPSLTKSERELCSLIRLNISNKDTGILLKTSTNAINVTRSRLRKKLGLSREEDMEVFIRKI